MDDTMTAHDIFTEALNRLRGYHGANGWMADFLQLWLSPNLRISCWFAGENDQVKVWKFQVYFKDKKKFTEAIPEAVKDGNLSRGFQLYKVSVPK